MHDSANAIEYYFEHFTVQPSERRLLSFGTPVEVAPRAFDLLLILLEHAGHLCTKESLLDQVWRGLVVEEANLHVQISALRKVLGADAIETVKRQGYRFCTDVTRRRLAVAGGTARASNLPRRLTSFVGRDTELGDLAGVLESTRLLTLHGLGGSGKTRLAIRLAELVAPAHPQGVWFVELAPVTDSTRIAQTVADAVGVRFATGQQVEAALREALAGRGALLILDNCEHMLEACADFTHRLLEAVYDLRVVTTSRVALGLPGERAVHVGPLTLEATARHDLAPEAGDAQALFAARAHAVAPALLLTEDARRLAGAICRQLDGMPLAIEIAAARLKVMSLRQLHDQLRNHAQAGDSSASTTPATLERIVSWSYEHLLPAHRVLARRCAVFAGGFDLQAAVAISASTLSPAAIADAMQSLVESSLLRVTHAPESTPRFAMLETVRQQMHALLAETDDIHEVERLHFFHYMQLAERASAKFVEGGKAHVRALDPERDNLVVAHRWCDGDIRRHPLGLQLANAMQGYWADRQFMLDMPPPEFDVVSQGYQLMREALARSGAQDRDTVRSRALAGAGQSARYCGRIAEALAYNDESLAIARECRDSTRICYRLLVRAWYHSASGEHDAARRLNEECLSLAATQGDPWLLKQAKLGRAGGLHLAGELVEAAALASEALEIARAHGQFLLPSLGEFVFYALACTDIVAVEGPLYELVTHDAVGRDQRHACAALAACTLMAEARGDARAVARFGAGFMRAAGPLPREPEQSEHAQRVLRIQRLLAAQSDPRLIGEQDAARRLALEPMLEEAADWSGKLRSGHGKRP